MRLVRICMSLAFLFAVFAPIPGRADDAAQTPVALVTRLPTDPCAFERSEAYGAGITNYTTEMLWGCEAVAKRRAARMPLGERLTRFADAMARYEEAVTTATNKNYAERKSTGWYTPSPSLSKEQKKALAEEAGALAALDEIRSGF